MSKVDFTKYKNLVELRRDIKEIKIQGATNVARAVCYGLKLYLETHTPNLQDYSFGKFVQEIVKVGSEIANVRPNEPLAENAVKYIKFNILLNTEKAKNYQITKELLINYCDNYLHFIEVAKKKSIELAKPILKGIDEVFTHCHSSTVEAMIINMAEKKENFKVVCSETRPLYQGRITATNLLNAGLNVTLIADSSSESFIIGKGEFNVDLIFLGCDEITIDGSAINKIGSFGVSLASYFASKPVYIVGTLLKVNVDENINNIKIERRDGREIWPEAPNDLKMYNPAFEVINSQFITGYLTEVGLVKPDEIGEVAKRTYEWMV